MRPTAVAAHLELPAARSPRGMTSMLTLSTINEQANHRRTVSCSSSEVLPDRPLVTPAKPSLLYAGLLCCCCRASTLRVVLSDDHPVITPGISFPVSRYSFRLFCLDDQPSASHSRQPRPTKSQRSRHSHANAHEGIHEDTQADIFLWFGPVEINGTFKEKVYTFCAVKYPRFVEPAMLKKGIFWSRH